MASQIKLRRGTAAQWTSANPTLAEGEAGFEVDTNKLKVGDGINTWNSLEYLTSSASVDFSDYLTISSASTTYAPIVNPVFTNNVQIEGDLKFDVVDGIEKGMIRVLSGPGYNQLQVYTSEQLNVYSQGYAGIYSDDNVIIGGTNGEFLNSSGSANQIATIGDLGGVTLADSGWINVSSLANSFTSGGNTPGYRKLNSVVYLRGNIIGGTGNTDAFTLPTGYRPATTFVIASQQFGTGDINYITINTDGTVVPNKSSAWLSGLVFPIG